MSGQAGLQITTMSRRPCIFPSEMRSCAQSVVRLNQPLPKRPGCSHDSQSMTPKISNEQVHVISTACTRTAEAAELVMYLLAALWKSAQSMRMYSPVRCS